MSKALFLMMLLPGVAMAGDARHMLSRGWFVQTSAKTGAGGEAISVRGYEQRGWTETTVPSTVLAARVAAGEFADPYFGMNLRKLPGATYPIAQNFSNLKMPADSPYAASWWYRTEFRTPEEYAGQRVWLHFDVINYRANVWLNGRRIATSKEVAGPYRTYELDVTDQLSNDGTNVLAVETFAPAENDLGITWVDWNPAPPDKNMGIWRDVYLTASGPVTVRYPAVSTRFADDSLRRAELTVVADVRNATGEPVEGVLAGTIGDVKFEQPVALAAGEQRTVRFAPDKFPQLSLDNPKVWWPAWHGPQTLHTVSVAFSLDGKVSDQASARFGIREVTSELTAAGHRMFRVNRKPILIRGAGWAPDMLLREPSPERLRTELEYVQHMNLNTIRLEGKMESDAFYDLCDEMGILVMAGWCCCDHWEMWDKWKPGDLEVAAACTRSQILRMRSHASVFVWINASDMPPPSNVETEYNKQLAAAAWPNPHVSNATAESTPVSGNSGVKMNGPYEYIAPSYWTRDKRFGGAFGFATEVGPGPAIPTVGSLRKMLPKDRLWPINEYWTFHAGGNEFKTLDRFNTALRKTYGEPKGLDDYVHKAQAMAYDGERAMFEAYGGNKYTSTGVIQWMLNNAWPSMIWHLYDYYLQPGGGYFATRKACEPLHIQFGYDDRSVRVVNSLYEPAAGLTASALVYDFDLKETFSKETPVDVPEDGVVRAFEIPAVALRGSSIHFVRLELRDSTGAVVSSNVYWLPVEYSQFAWDKTFFVHTPMSSYEDLRRLNDLPRARLTQSVKLVDGGDEVRVEVTLRNPGPHLAFQTHLSVASGAGKDEVAPIFWSDNYVTIFPGETKTITARFPKQAAPLVLEVDGLNLETLTIPLGGER